MDVLLEKDESNESKLSVPLVEEDSGLYHSSREEKPTSSTPTVTIDLTEDDSVVEKLKPTPVDLVKE